MLLFMGDVSAKTTSGRSFSSRSFSSGSRPSFKPSPAPSRPSGTSFSSKPSVPSAPKPSSGLSSGLSKLGEKSMVAPVKPATAVPTPAPATKSYYSSPPRAPKPEAVRSVPAGREMRYEPGRGYGYTDNLGTFMVIDAISDAASTAILANALSGDKGEREQNTKTSTAATTGNQPDGSGFWGGMILVAGILGFAGLLAWAFSRST